MSIDYLLKEYPLLTLFCGTTLFLSIATVIGRVLKLKRSPHQAHSVIDNLNDRINAWWWIVAILGIAFVTNKAGVTILFALLSFTALREFMSLLRTRSGDHKSLLLAFFFFLPLQFYFVFIEWYGLFVIFIPVYAFLVLPAASALAGDGTHFFDRSAKIQWGLMVCVFCLSHVPALMTLHIDGYFGRETLLIAYLILVVQMSDVFQYVWGKLLGKRLLAPTISPSKTVEGLIGGVCTATLLGVLLTPFTPFTWWQSGLIALIITLMGFLGGLVLSALKRDLGVKDWGTLIEGHGGVLDRLDSITFSAPVFFHIIRYWWT